MNQRLLYLMILCSVPLFLGANNDGLNRKYEKEQVWTSEAKLFLDCLIADSISYCPLPYAQVDTLYKKRGIHLNFTEEFAYRALRSTDVDDIVLSLRQHLGLKSWQHLFVTVDGLPLEYYVPLVYSKRGDRSREGKAVKRQHVVNESKTYCISKGLSQRHIALWNSHGKYYNHMDSCWTWQRAPLFTTVEDLFTSTYVLPFLLPMLEQAGANVYLPRERDVQIHEFIVDDADKYFGLKGRSVQVNRGFKNGLLLDRSDMNPFEQGQSYTLSQGATATWQLAIPEKGNYAVYVSYACTKNNSDEAYYTVCHAGGETHFRVDQTMGAGTWVYLGNFDFEGKAEISLTGKHANADAVRIGGGMGSIPRQGKVSGVPRWQEAARYYLQYSGALDSLTFNRHGDTIDYNDDFRSRARWVNYLMGKDAIEPWITQGAKVDGLNIPIDLSLGLHTDAGHFLAMDTIVGTLAIYSTYDVAKNRSFYYSKKTRMANRDLADMIQTQFVDDVRALYDSTWTRRDLWDKMYSEATFAQAPSLLLELHGHGNVQDMRYGLNPKFRFDVSRAIYKASLKFLARYYKQDYVVQPLPVQSVAIIIDGRRRLLRWSPTIDPLEPSAQPEAYMVYKQSHGLGWDNGTLVRDTSFILPQGNTELCAYRVTAVNAGGESFPSHALSLVEPKQATKRILVVDGFSRVDAPAFVACGDSVGVAPWHDEGVPYGLDIGTIGWQYNYNQRDLWVSDEEPGHGASSFELSDSLFLGNGFNTSYAFAKAIGCLGYSVHSASAEAVEQGQVDLWEYDAVVMAYGEQRCTYLPKGEKIYDLLSEFIVDELKRYLDRGGKLFLNGAHIATSTLEGDDNDKKMRQAFLSEYCGISFAAKVKPVDNELVNLLDSSYYHYNVAYRQDYYRVENADAFVLEPGARAVDLYANDYPATVECLNKGRVIVSGVPFETILGEVQRVELMKIYLELLFDEDN